MSKESNAARIERYMDRVESLLDEFLVKYGWVEDEVDNTWSKDESHTLTNAEAYWREIRE